MEGYIFCPLSKIRKHNLLIDAPRYCVGGYPTINKRKEKGILRTGASVLLFKPAKPNVYKYYSFNPDLEFVLEIKGKGTSLKDGSVSKLRGEFYGMSGCGLWLIVFNEKENKLIIACFFSMKRMIISGESGSQINYPSYHLIN